MDERPLSVYFVSHGGGPWPWMDDARPVWATMAASLRSMPTEIGVAPRAILCITAHWEAPAFTVQTHPNPPMLYDYGGFPEHTYRVQYPAPGSPSLAARVSELLGGAGLDIADDPARGFDHGTFVPLAVAWPGAEIPVVQLSIHRSFDPALHLSAGRALAPLRDEGVFILASGFTFHNMAMLGSPASAEAPSRLFDAWLAETMMDCEPADRTSRLEAWSDAPAARVAHPREEHLLPLMVAVGAAELDQAERVYEDDLFGFARVASYRLG